MTVPTVPQLRTYFGSAADHVEDAALTDALEAEKAAQARVCRVDHTAYPDDLAQALKRRVRRNLAMRGIPLGVMADAEGGGVRVGSNDPEIRRLEAPFRKVLKG